jgi:hypothetical protein
MLSSFDMVGRQDETQGANPMKRLLLTVAAATAIMLTACIDVELAPSGQASNGERVRLVNDTPASNSSDGGDETAGEETGTETRRGDAADVRPAPHGDVRARS